MSTLFRMARACSACLLLAIPLVAVKLWVLLVIGSYAGSQFACDALAVLAVSALAVFVVRWRAVGAVSWPLAFAVYSTTAIVEIAEAVSFYFQASSFNTRFFANLRLANLPSAIGAFPLLLGIVAFGLLAILAVAGWLLSREARAARPLPARRVRVLGIAGTGLLVAIIVLLPSAFWRLADAFRSDASLAASARGRQVTTRLVQHPVARDDLRARAGKNLVIIYMESLERIYTDKRIFPGLTPSLDRWRAQGLDFSGFLTFSGATFTMAGIFASQCGSGYYTSPSSIFDSSGDDPNDSTFHPELACLGDVLHKAGYQQVFMNGSPLSFANQGNFFRMHGFNQVLGLDELEHENGSPMPAPGWGLYDSDLFRLATNEFRRLAASGKPFNLDVLTIDNHPPHGRPSPGCPKYANNDNDQLQAVHCTDFLVGRFLDTISQSPAWKDTVVVVMSDHLSMRNDAWPLYPGWYRRRPLLFVLNAGRGKRKQRFYHMDIAPTVLHLMGVATNATFVAGADRSAPDSSGSPLLNDPADVAAVRHVLWNNAKPLQVCQGGMLLQSNAEGLVLAGRRIPLTQHGAPLVGLSTGQSLGVVVGKTALVTVVGTPAELAAKLNGRDAAALILQPLADRDPMLRFSVAWRGRNGALARLADVPRLSGLELKTPDCASLIAAVDRAPAGAKEDLQARFQVRTAPLYPALPQTVDFTQPNIRTWQRGVGWLPSASWGSWALGDFATLGFTLPADACRAARLEITARPFLATSRPRLDVDVSANGHHMATWQLTSGDAQPRMLELPAGAIGPACRVDLRFDFTRPGATSPPYPVGEDPRPLQLDFIRMEVHGFSPAMAQR
jgi:phosphoglycerol transferase MdoB-like AlkP superfamily enzyme